MECAVCFESDQIRKTGSERLDFPCSIALWGGGFIEKSTEREREFWKNIVIMLAIGFFCSRVKVVN